MSVNIRVLVVDDMKSSCLMLARMLTRLGVHFVETAISADEAIELAKSDRPDLIISDFHMPGMDGLELLETIRDQPEFRDCAFVLATGQDSSKMREKSRNLGALDVLIKPLRMDDLHYIVETVRRKLDAASIEKPAFAKSAGTKERLDRFMQGGIGMLA